MTIFHLTPSEIQGLFLIFVRIGAICFTAPVFSDRRIPIHVRMAISLVLAIILQPLVAPDGVGVSATPLIFASLLVKEALVGIIIGFGANLVFQIVQMAGEMQDVAAGFGFSGLVDPQLQQSGAILGQFQMVLMWMIFLAVNGHYVVLQGISDSFYAVPITEATFQAGMTQHMLTLTTSIMLIALRMSAPVIASVLLADVAMGMLQRTAPQLNIIAVGFPVKIALAISVFMLALPFMLPMMRDLAPYMERVMHGFLQFQR